MTTTREATAAAAAWVDEEGARTPGFVGALLVGSTLERSPEEPVPPGADVDLWLVIDGPVPDARRDPPSPLWPHKFAYRGLVLERGYFSWEKLQDPAAVLANPYIAPALAHGVRLADPSGRLAALAAAVGAALGRRIHARARLEAMQEQALAVTAEVERVLAEPAATLPAWRTEVFQHAVHLSATLPAIAALRTPTIRRTLVLAREVLAAHGEAPLAEGLLEALGSAGVTRAQAEAHLDELARAFDAAVAVHRTRFGRDWNVSAATRSMVLDGLRAGLGTQHRELLSHALVIRNIAQRILENDAPEAERALHREGLLRLYAALDLADEAGVRRRLAALRALQPRLRAVAERLLPAE